MAFIYCDKCNWQQDDFWCWRYNPIRSFFGRIRDYGWPRMMEFDPPPYSYGRIFSWSALWREWGKVLRRIPRQVWWTAADFKKAMQGEKWPACPKCGAHKLIAD